jgi:peptide-methionine (R)-S-oxide reductase
MKRTIWLTLTLLVLAFLAVTAFAAGTGATPPMPASTPTAAAAPGPLTVYTDKVVKSDDEWKKTLTGEQYRILRQGGTEFAGSGGALLHNHAKGVYRCAACGQLLFSSDTKFESGTGWPSFFKPFSPQSVVEKKDSTLGMERTEILCSRCGGHLGHVFDDGPAPTHLRYCMNAGALKFEPTK